MDKTKLNTAISAQNQIFKKNLLEHANNLLIIVFVSLHILLDSDLKLHAHCFAVPVATDYHTQLLLAKIFDVTTQLLLKAEHVFHMSTPSRSNHHLTRKHVQV